MEYPNSIKLMANNKELYKSKLKYVKKKPDNMKTIQVPSNLNEIKRNAELEYTNIEFLLETDDQDNELNDFKGEDEDKDSSYQTVVEEDTEKILSNSKSNKRKFESTSTEDRLELSLHRYLEAKQRKLTKSAEDQDRERTEQSTDETMNCIASEMKKLAPDVQSKLRIEFMRKLHEELYEK